jgi:hypothetical protein
MGCGRGDLRGAVVCSGNDYWRKFELEGK